MIERFLVWLLEWWTGNRVQLGNRWFRVPDGMDGLVAEAHALAARFELPGRSGEWKRHQVLAALMDRHPGEDQRDLALAIELAVRRL
jgi:hypothetical protein